MIKRDEVKDDVGLSISTKTLLIIALVLLSIAMVWIIVKSIDKQNVDETPIDKFSADLQVSNVEIVNSTNVNVKIDKGIIEGELKYINLLFYDEDGKEIKRSKILMSDLEENDFSISFRVSNTSRIKSISITPVFTSEDGKSIIGDEGEEYTIENTNKEYPEEEFPQEEILEEEIPSCTLDSDCNDDNGCTTNTCIDGNCSYALIENCVSCSLSSQCEDSNACTTNSCSDGKCSYLLIPGCTPCGSNLNCNDSSGCTNNICVQGRCLYTTIENCKSCVLSSECDDNNACTDNLCLNNACSYSSVSNCKNCTLFSQCADNDSSTSESCSNNKCVYTKITSCKNNDGYCPNSCGVAEDNDCSYICGNGVREGNEKCDGNSLGGATCAGVRGAGYTGTLNCFLGLCTFDTSLCVAPCTCPSDGNSCTTDQCVDNVCKHIALTGTSCLSDNNACTKDICGANGTCAHVPQSNCCISNSQCNDNNICTTDSCSSNSCLNSPVSNCCISNSQCNDNNICTTDSCSSNSCLNSPVSNCCISNSQCNDNNICTTDSCSSNSCLNSPVSNCCISNSQCGSGRVCTNNVCVTSNIPPTSTSGHTYYLSPSGNDNTGNGSINRPWFTLEKAWNVVSAGDTIYMRGGTYEYSEQTLGGKSGSAGNLIKVWAFPGETPIITKSSTGSYDQPRALIHIPNGDYLHFRGLELSYFEQENQYLWSCLWVFNSENSIFEQLNIHHCGMGALLENTDNCLVLNSDFHHNSDPLTSYDVYGNADGLGMSGDYGKTNTIRGCRFWWNTDDGIDLYGVEGNVIIEDSWAWNNGFVPDTFNDGGDGNGFKLGDTFTSRPTTVLRTVTNSVAFHNKMFGFHDNDAKCNMELYNNIAYQNCYMGYESWCGGFHFVMPGAPYYIKNNIAYNNLGDDVALDVLTNVNHNSWDTNGVSVSNADFLSVDSSCMDDSRKADGSLPSCNFLKLKQGSDLIDKGINVGLPFNGNAPDLGAYESNY